MDISSIGNAGVATSQALEPERPAEQLVAQFDQAMAPATAAHTGGVLNTISDVTAQISQAKQTLKARMSAPGDVSPSSLMELQYSLLQINMQQELIAKAVGRLTQNVETLMKTQ
ncbi:type III secretion system inner rod subunit SctI [Pseudomonas fontis]|nr:type III secretion system inner rod subunit SctI [Pseudomonas fontis]